MHGPITHGPIKTIVVPYARGTHLVARGTHLITDLTHS